MIALRTEAKVIVKQERVYFLFYPRFFCTNADQLARTVDRSLRLSPLVSGVSLALYPDRAPAVPVLARSSKPMRDRQTR